MAAWHGYIGIEDVALTAPQRAAIVQALKGLRGVNGTNPAHINHWRISLDGSKAIFEARFNEDNLTIANVKQFVADAVGVSAALIDHEVTQTPRGPVVTFSAGGSPRMRFIAFAGVGETYADSHTQVPIYLYNNIAEWEAA